MTPTFLSTNAKLTGHELHSIIEALWPIVIEKAGLNSALLIPGSYYDPARRVYTKGQHVYKIVLIEYESTGHLRNQDLQGEFAILRNCAGIPGVPSAIEVLRDSDFEMLVIEKMPGNSIENIGFFNLLRVMCKLSVIVFRLACRGISHNDIHHGNILLSDVGDVSLIDFDQATLPGFVTGIARSYFGIKSGEMKMRENFLSLIKQGLKNNLPPRLISVIRRLLQKKTNNKLPILPERAAPNLVRLHEAWRIAQLSDASAPNVEVAYYSFNFEGYHFPGERPWESRWKTLRSITDYSDKRVLELGCNMSFLSCFLLKEEKAATAMGVDIDENILKAAKLVSSVLGVNPEYRQQDFDSLDNWEKELKDFKPDLVFALNVLNWVHDKERFMNFLGSFNEIILEGHDDFETERNRFVSRGFKDVQFISTSERKRPIIHCRK